MSITQSTFINRLVQKISDSSYVAADIIEDVNTAIRKLTIKWNIPFFRKKTTWTATTATSTQDMSSKLSDLMAEKIIMIYTTSRGEIEIISGDDWGKHDYTEDTTGDPDWAWWTTYQQLQTDKKFSTADTIHTVYYRKHTEVSSTGTAIDFPEQHEALLEHEALAMAYDALEDDRYAIEERRRDRAMEALLDEISGEEPSELR